MKIFQDKTVDLDLNGPILSFTTNPIGVGSTGVGINSTGGGSVELTGIATATFPTSADNSGIITYRWYEEGVGALSDSTYVTGTATTTLTLTNLITPTDNQRKFYLQADYIPSYYETGNAINEPFNSGVGTVTVDPLIEVIAQPSSQTTIVGTDIRAGVFDTGKSLSLTVNADLTDSYFPDDLTYQWFIDGEAATDEVREKTTTTSSTVSGTVEETFTSNGTHTFPSSIENVEITVAGASGGNGGSDAGGPGGRGAQGRAGRFSLPSNFKDNILTLGVGRRGNGGSSGGRGSYGEGGSSGQTGSGARGGGAGQRGWSGGGGGGGAASYVDDPTGTIIVSAGGGGGGGGSHNRGGDSGFNRNPGVGLGYGHGNSSSPINVRGGSAGQDKDGDGGGGGGGGGGVSGGSGGSAGHDNSHGGEAGGGGTSGANTTVATLQGSGWLNDSDGYINLKYTGNTSTEVTTIRKTVISGSTSATLQLACDTVGVQTAQCKISSATASNSYVMTDEVNAVFVSTADQNNLNVEAIGVTDTATLSSINLNNGEYTFNLENTDADNNGINQFYSLYSPDKAMSVEMDLYGGKGSDGQGGASGGEGGYSRIRFTMDQNIEYVIAGLISSVNTPFLYRKGSLMACVGQGGGANNTAGQSGGSGGSGGGVNISGDNGNGGGAGQGGDAFPSGESLGGNGIFGSSYSAPTVYPADTQATGNDGGRTIKCTKGVYWRNQGIGSCDDVTASSKFRLSDGTEVTNTSSSITRGFKAGYNIMQTAGSSTTLNGGQGGNGVRGGEGATASAGGGGGSGYQDGTVTVVATQQGGSTGNAKVVLRVVT